MKLMLCRHCGDVLALRHERRSCACGATWGQYREDGVDAVQSEGSVSLAIHSHDLLAAIREFDHSRDAWHPFFVFRAYLNPRCEPDIRYVADPEGEE